MLGPSLRIKNESTHTQDIYPLYGKVKFVLNAFMKIMGKILKK